MGATSLLQTNSWPRYSHHDSHPHYHQDDDEDEDEDGDEDDVDNEEITKIMPQFKWGDFHQRLLHLKKAVLPILSNQDVAVLIVSLELLLLLSPWNCGLK